MKTSMLLVTIVSTGALLAAHSTAKAAITISAGSLYLTPGGIEGQVAASIDSSGLNTVLQATSSTPGNYASGHFLVTNDGFSMDNVTIARSARHITTVDCQIDFTVTSDTSYDLSGFLRFAVYDQPVISGLNSLLQNSDTGTYVYDMEAFNTTAYVGQVDLGVAGSGDISIVQGSPSGTLSPGNYHFEVLFELGNARSTADGATGIGGISLVFTDAVGNIPEPASFGILALASAGLFLHRRR